MSYEMIDRFLRNNLGDDDYAKYSDALNALCTPQRTWVGLVWGELPEDGQNHDFLRGAVWAETKLKEKNQ